MVYLLRRVWTTYRGIIWLCRISGCGESPQERKQEIQEAAGGRHFPIDLLEDKSGCSPAGCRPSNPYIVKGPPWEVFPKGGPLSSPLFSGRSMIWEPAGKWGKVIQKNSPCPIEERSKALGCPLTPLIQQFLAKDVFLPRESWG